MGETYNYMTFYRSYLDAIEDLSEKDQLALVMAILRYGLKGEEPELHGDLAAMFKLIKQNIVTKQDVEVAKRRWLSHERRSQYMAIL